MIDIYKINISAHSTEKGLKGNTNERGEETLLMWQLKQSCDLGPRTIE